MDIEAPTRRPPKRSRRPFVTGFFPWAVTILLAAMLVAMIVGCWSLIVAVKIDQPHSPFVSVREATLDKLSYDLQSGTLTEVKVALQLEARNIYAHSGATFSGLEGRVALAGTTLTVLQAQPFRVPASGVQPLDYVATAQGALLDKAGRDVMDTAQRDDHIVPFEVSVKTKTQWKFLFATIHQTASFKCQIRFIWTNGTALPFSCTSWKKGYFESD